MTISFRKLVLLPAAGVVATAGIFTGSAGQSHAAGSRQTVAAVPVMNYHVSTGWGTDDYAANIYTPNSIQIYANDSVTWTIKGALEPHTITFGPYATLQRLANNSVTPVPQKGGPPNLVFNPRIVFPTPSHVYQGLGGVVNSGFLTAGKSWTARFPRPGVYRYYCLIHFPGMSGTVVVRPRPMVSRAFTVQSGYGSSVRSVADAFFPENLTVRAGATVTFTPGFHTVTFTTGAMAQQLRRQLIIPMPQKNGPPTMVFNPRIAFPAGGSTYNGVGFWNSGLLTSGPARVTLTRPGVYHYYCLVHPGMDGVIRVIP